MNAIVRKYSILAILFCVGVLCGILSTKVAYYENITSLQSDYELAQWQYDRVFLDRMELYKKYDGALAQIVSLKSTIAEKDVVIAALEEWQKQAITKDFNHLTATKQ